MPQMPKRQARRPCKTRLVCQDLFRLAATQALQMLVLRAQGVHYHQTIQEENEAGRLIRETVSFIGLLE